jgi:hypothetical protein
MQRQYARTLIRQGAEKKFFRARVSRSLNPNRTIPPRLNQVQKGRQKRRRTAYFEAGGTLENAQAMAAHESPRTTKLYDRTGDEITLDEVERITI